MLFTSEFYKHDITGNSHNYTLDLFLYVQMQFVVFLWIKVADENTNIDIYIYNIRTLFANIKFICMSFRNR